MGPQNPRQLCGKIYCYNEDQTIDKSIEKNSLTNSSESTVERSQQKDDDSNTEIISVCDIDDDSEATIEIIDLTEST